MRSTQERFREVQEAMHKRCNTDPQVIKEREEFFSTPRLAINTTPSNPQQDKKNTSEGYVCFYVKESDEKLKKNW